MPAIADRNHKWTVDEVWALPDVPGERYECVDGELLVSPGPTLPHERAFMYLARAIATYVEGPPRVGEALGSRTDVVLDSHTLVQPDVFVAPLVDGRRLQENPDRMRLLLAIEILSPSSQRADRIVKRRKYQRWADVYWIVDTEARLIERWHPDDDRPEIMTETIAWHPAGREQPLVINLTDLFCEAHGEAP